MRNADKPFHLPKVLGPYFFQWWSELQLLLSVYKHILSFVAILLVIEQLHTSQYAHYTAYLLTYLCTYLFIHTYVCTYTHTYVGVYMHMCMHTLTHIHTDTDTTRLL